MLKFMKPDFFYNIIHFFGSEVRNYNKDVVRAFVEARVENSSQNPDYLDIMMEMFANEKTVGNSMIKPAIGNCPQKVELMIDNAQMQAQIFILFAAGYETASSAASYTLHQLAFNPEKYEKCQKEIDESSPIKTWQDDLRSCTRNEICRNGIQRGSANVSFYRIFYEEV